MLEILPIAKTQLDWNLYLESCRKILGKTASTVTTVGAIETLGNPIDHIFYSILILSTERYFLRLIENICGLKVSMKEAMNPDFTLAIFSGTLREWRNFILECNDPILTNKLDTYFRSIEGHVNLLKVR